MSITIATFSKYKGLRLRKISTHPIAVMEIRIGRGISFFRREPLVVGKKESANDKFPYIPCKRTVYRIMERLGIVHTPKHKLNGIIKADREPQVKVS